MNFKPSEFLHVLRKIERLLRDAVAELIAIRELLEEEEGYTIAEYTEFLRRGDETTTVMGGIVVENES